MDDNLTLVFAQQSEASEAHMRRDLRVECDLVKPATRTSLDIGCAGGRLASLLAERTQLTVGIDVSLDLLQQAAARCRKQGSGKIAFVVADLLHPPFRPGSFDYVVSRFTLHHTDLDVSLPIVRSLVSSRGRLVLRDVFAWTPRLHPYRWSHYLPIALKVTREAKNGGLRSALRQLRHLLSAESMHHMTHVNRQVSRRRYREAHRRWLPGCSFRAETESLLFGTAPLVIWEPSALPLNEHDDQ